MDGKWLFYPDAASTSGRMPDWGCHCCSTAVICLVVAFEETCWINYICVSLRNTCLCICKTWGIGSSISFCLCCLLIWFHDQPWLKWVERAGQLFWYSNVGSLTEFLWLPEVFTCSARGGGSWRRSTRGAQLDCWMWLSAISTKLCHFIPPPL